MTSMLVKRRELAGDGAADQVAVWSEGQRLAGSEDLVFDAEQAELKIAGKPAVTEAPLDGQPYARQGGRWRAVPAPDGGGGGGSSSGEGEVGPPGPPGPQGPAGPQGAAGTAGPPARSVPKGLPDPLAIPARPDRPARRARKGQPARRAIPARKA